MDWSGGRIGLLNLDIDRRSGSFDCLLTYDMPSRGSSGALLHWDLKQWVLVGCLGIEIYDAYLHGLSSASDRRIHE